MNNADANTATLMQYDARKKSALVAYLLLFLVGWFGAHRFYMGKISAGVWQLILLACAIGLWFSDDPLGIHFGGHLRTGVILGGLVLLLINIRLFIDLFTIPRSIRQYNTALASELS